MVQWVISLEVELKWSAIYSVLQALNHLKTYFIFHWKQRDNLLNTTECSQFYIWGEKTHKYKASIDYTYWDQLKMYRAYGVTVQPDFTYAIQFYGLCDKLTHNVYLCITKMPLWAYFNLITKNCVKPHLSSVLVLEDFCKSPVVFGSLWRLWLCKEHQLLTQSKDSFKYKVYTEVKYFIIF